MIICKRLDPLDDHLQEARSSVSINNNDSDNDNYNYKDNDNDININGVDRGDGGDGAE